MVDFRLADWEFFQAPTNAQGDMATIEFIRTSPATHRIYGYGWMSDIPGDPPAEDVWLSPKIVPARVLRGDCGWPRISPEQARALCRPHALSTDEQDDLDDAEPIPAPEMLAQTPDLTWLAENVKAALDQAKRAHKAGFTLTMKRARGPRLDAHWKVSDIADSVRLDGTHPDGRTFAAHWQTKTTTERAKVPGVASWGFDFAYILKNRVVTRCNATELSTYCK